jgi:hypothetical protein
VSQSFIKGAIFTCESYAHLRGREQEILPLVDGARAEHAQLIEALERCSKFIGDNWQAFGYQSEPDTLVQARAALEVAK